MAERADMEKDIRSSLFTYVDFFDAAIFVFILAEVMTKVIDTQLSLLEKTNRISLVMGVFYLFTWDWVHTRLLTLKNPLTRYRRFAFDILGSLFGYGAALRALQAKPTFLIYVAVILFAGVLWAIAVMREHPESEDKTELETAESLQTIVAGVLVVAYLYLHIVLEVGAVGILETIFYLGGGWAFVFYYEFCLDRESGILGGPGILFLSRQRIDVLRVKFSRFTR